MRHGIKKSSYCDPKKQANETNFWTPWIFIRKTCSNMLFLWLCSYNCFNSQNDYRRMFNDQNKKKIEYLINGWRLTKETVLKITGNNQFTSLFKIIIGLLPFPVQLEMQPYQIFVFDWACVIPTFIFKKKYEAAR